MTHLHAVPFDFVVISYEASVGGCGRRACCSRGNLVARFTNLAHHHRPGSPKTEVPLSLTKSAAWVTSLAEYANRFLLDSDLRKKSVKVRGDTPDDAS